MILKTAIFYLSVLLLTANCALRKNNGAGYGGGDPLLGVLHDSQTQIGKSARLILSGVDTAALCSARQCQFPNENSQCFLLDGLSSDQRSYCAAVIQASAEHLQSFSTRSLADSFSLTDEAISVADAQGGSVAVTAKTMLGSPSPIVLHRARLNLLSGNQIIALLAHEVGHQYLYLGNIVSDNNPVGPFASGRQLLDVVGAALAIYHNDHVQRPGGLDFSYFNGRRTFPLGEFSVSEARMREGAKLEMVTAPVMSIDGGVLELFSETVGTLDFGTSTISYRANPDALESGDSGPQIIPAALGGTIYLANKFDESGSSLTAVRFKADGSIDSSFGDSARPGRVQLSRSDLAEGEYEYVTDAQVDGLNRLHFGDCVSNGASSLCDLIRLKANGERDADYNTRLASDLEQRSPGSSIKTLKLLTDGTTIALLKQNDESYVMTHVLENGAIDPEFGVDGFSVVQGHSPVDADFDSALDFTSLEVSNDRILIIEQNSTRDRLVLSRLTSKGAMDLGFGMGGTVSIMPATGDSFVLEKVLYQSNGKILLVGLLNNVYLKVSRLDRRGVVDQIYGELGVSLIPLGSSLQSFADASVDAAGALTIALSGKSATAAGNEVTIMKLRP